jgi:glutaredoxin-like YruB-family protein
MTKKVIVYTTPSCPFCFAVKEFLKQKGIKFKEVDVAKDEKAQKEMIEKSGQMGVPVVEIDGEIVVGFDKEKICQILGIQP